MISSTTRIGIAALFASVLLSSAMPASATLYTCHQLVTGVGRSSTGLAWEKAVQHWSKRTAGAYGSSFAKWVNADSRGGNCNEIEGISYCRVYGKPCNGPY
jgi:hypothetical protein